MSKKYFFFQNKLIKRKRTRKHVRPVLNFLNFKYIKTFLKKSDTHMHNTYFMIISDVFLK